ncbi:hypothetical protein [Dietzia sp. ANT_WB102]|uniref:hypothetical protein n=1 Tax=Dietzia sp. ANT_WB102 TaxID=2597345 RepID=UPI0011EBF6C3|nr:hypothetical protein [Dietzia sp. ANT_WB102]KAA0919140.1 hypothetical protein FQ137_07620 [Dietzia sp. ANT_WB102]
MENNGSPPRPTSPDPAPYDPTAALADVDSARRAVADRLISPWWYHPTLAVILAAIMLTAALNLPNIVRVPVAVAGAVGIVLLIAGYQRTTGLWVDMRNLGPISRRWWFAYAAVVLVVLVISLWPTATDQALPLWLAILLAVVAIIAQIVLGRRVDDAMRAEIRAGTAVAPRRR